MPLKPPEYGFFLIYLVVMLVIMPTLYGVFAVDRFLDLFVWGMMIVGSWAIFPNKKARIICLILVTSMLILHLSLINDFSQKKEIIWVFIHIVFSFIMLLKITSQIIQSNEINRNIVIAAVCNYLIFGIFMALIYHLIDIINPQAFEGTFTEGSITPEIGSHILTFVYFSFVTLTTLGYGDIIPISATARSFASAEAIVGQIFIATVLAHLVSVRVHSELQAKKR